MSLLMDFIEEVIIPTVREGKTLIEEANEGLGIIKNDYRNLNVEDKKEVRKSFKSEFKELFDMVRKDGIELEKDFNEMIVDVKDSLAEKEDVTKVEKESILGIIKLTNPKYTVDKILEYEENPIGIIDEDSVFIGDAFDQLKEVVD